MEKVAEREKADLNPASVIGPDTVITGNIEAGLTLQIDGRITGDVRCATLILGEESVIKGNVFADRVRVSGTVEGGIDAKDLAVEATARVTGDVSYERLKVANGGILQGHLKCKAMEEDANEANRLKLVEPTNGTKPIYIE